VRLLENFLNQRNDGEAKTVSFYVFLFHQYITLDQFVQNPMGGRQMRWIKKMKKERRIIFHEHVEKTMGTFRVAV